MNILFLDILTDDPEVRADDEIRFASLGGYKGVVTRALLSSADDVEVEYLDAGTCGIEILSHLCNSMCPLLQAKWAQPIDGIVIGGSATNIGGDDRIARWQENVMSIFHRAAFEGIPVLGLCGGHQFGARGINGNTATITVNPMGRNFGTWPVWLTAAGKKHPLFAGCGSLSLFQWSHRYIVARPPNDGWGVVVLAHHAASFYAALQWQSFIGLQFHPEIGVEAQFGYGAEMMRGLAMMRKDALIAEGFVADAAAFERFLERGIVPAPDSHLILKNWINMIRSGYFAQFKR